MLGSLGFHELGNILVMQVTFIGDILTPLFQAWGDDLSLQLLKLQKEQEEKERE